MKSEDYTKARAIQNEMQAKKECAEKVESLLNTPCGLKMIIEGKKYSSNFEVAIDIFNKEMIEVALNKELDRLNKSISDLETQFNSI